MKLLRLFIQHVQAIVSSEQFPAYIAELILTSLPVIVLFLAARNAANSNMVVEGSDIFWIAFITSVNTFVEFYKAQGTKVSEKSNNLRLLVFIIWLAIIVCLAVFIGTSVPGEIQLIPSLGFLFIFICASAISRYHFLWEPVKNYIDDVAVYSETRETAIAAGNELNSDEHLRLQDDSNNENLSSDN